MKIENREKFLTFLTIGLIGLLAADWWVLTPLLNAWKTRSERIVELTKSVNTGNYLLDRERSIRGRWETMKTNALPSDVFVAQDSVFKSAARWADDSKFGLESLKPTKKQGDDFVTIECRADGKGSIDTLTKFIYELEQDSLPLKVEDLEITARDNEGQQLSLGVRFSGLLLQTDEK